MDFSQSVCKYRSGYDVWKWIFLKSVVFEKILWKLKSLNFWYFNRMSEDNENKVRKSNEKVVDNGVSLEKINDSSWLYKILGLYSFLFDK